MNDVAKNYLFARQEPAAAGRELAFVVLTLTSGHDVSWWTWTHWLHWQHDAPKRLIDRFTLKCCCSSTSQTLATLHPQSLVLYILHIALLTMGALWGPTGTKTLYYVALYLFSEAAGSSEWAASGLLNATQTQTQSAEGAITAESLLVQKPGWLHRWLKLNIEVALPTLSSSLLQLLHDVGVVLLQIWLQSCYATRVHIQHLVCLVHWCAECFAAWQNICKGLQNTGVSGNGPGTNPLLPTSFCTKASMLTQQHPESTAATSQHDIRTQHMLWTTECFWPCCQ